MHDDGAEQSEGGTGGDTRLRGPSDPERCQSTSACSPHFPTVLPSERRKTLRCCTTRD